MAPPWTQDDRHGCSGQVKQKDSGLCILSMAPLPLLPPVVARGPIHVRILNVSVCECVCVCMIRGVFLFDWFYWGPPSSLMGPTCGGGPGQLLLAAVSQMELASMGYSPTVPPGVLGMWKCRWGCVLMDFFSRNDSDNERHISGHLWARQ